MLLKSRFPSQLCRCQYCERITPDATVQFPRLAGRRSFRFIWRVAAFSTFYMGLWSGCLNMMAFAGEGTDALKNHLITVWDRWFA